MPRGQYPHQPQTAAHRRAISRAVRAKLAQPEVKARLRTGLLRWHAHVRELLRREREGAL